MDLQTMSVKIENGMYTSRQEFEADFRLMIRNCKTYNSEGTYAYGEAVGLEAYFEKGSPRFHIFFFLSQNHFCCSLGENQCDGCLCRESCSSS